MIWLMVESLSQCRHCWLLAGLEDDVPGCTDPVPGLMFRERSRPSPLALQFGDNWKQVQHLDCIEIANLSFQALKLQCKSQQAFASEAERWGEVDDGEWWGFVRRSAPQATRRGA